MMSVSFYSDPKYQSFPGGFSGKEPACQCRRHNRCGFNPWVGKIPWRRAQLTPPVFLNTEESHEQRSWRTIVHRVTKNQICLNRISTHPNVQDNHLIHLYIIIVLHLELSPGVLRTSYSFGSLKIFVQSKIKTVYSHTHTHTKQLFFPKKNNEVILIHPRSKLQSPDGQSIISEKSSATLRACAVFKISIHMLEKSDLKRGSTWFKLASSLALTF